MPGYSASRWHVEDYPHFTGSVAGAPVSLQVEMSCHPALIQCKRTYHMRWPAANARRKMFPSNFGFRGEPDRICLPHRWVVNLPWSPLCGISSVADALPHPHRWVFVGSRILSHFLLKILSKVILRRFWGTPF